MVDKESVMENNEIITQEGEVLTAGQESEQETVAEAPPSLEEQLAEYLDGWRRSRAELANFKRRTENQRAEMALNANADLLTRLLPVLDDLQLALDNSPGEDAGGSVWQEWRDGVVLVGRKFTSVLEGVGVTLIKAEGELFDPNVHEAISNEANPDFESGQIIAQVRQGYKLGNRVLRATMVRVAQ